MAAEQKPVGLHRIEDDLTETWIADWAEAGFKDMEPYLAKRLKFIDFILDKSIDTTSVRSSEAEFAHTAS